MPKNIVGQWDVVQSNGFTVHMEVNKLAQNGSFGGTASVVGTAGVRELANGRVTDDEITFDVPVGNVTGRYTGRFDSGGRLTGNGFQIEHPEVQATWFVDKQFRR